MTANPNGKFKPKPNEIHIQVCPINYNQVYVRSETQPTQAVLHKIPSAPDERKASLHILSIEHTLRSEEAPVTSPVI